MLQQQRIHQEQVRKHEQSQNPLDYQSQLHKTWDHYSSNCQQFFGECLQRIFWTLNFALNHLKINNTFSKLRVYLCIFIIIK